MDDHTPANELRLDLDPIIGSTRALAPLIDPNEHSCGTVPPHGVDELTHPEVGYYVVGAKSYGRAPTFLLATGYGKGSALFKLGAEGPQQVWKNKVLRTQLNAGVLVNGFVYGVDGDTTEKASLKCIFRTR